MLGWGGGDVNVPCTCTHVGCYARCWVGVGVDVNVPSNHKTFWKNFKKIWRSKSKCQNASSFRVHKKRTFVIKHNRMALAKREYQWNCAEKSRAAAWTPKTNGNTDSKLRKIQSMYWKHHGRLHTVYLVSLLQGLLCGQGGLYNHPKRDMYLDLLVRWLETLPNIFSQMEWKMVIYHGSICLK